MSGSPRKRADSAESVVHAILALGESEPTYADIAAVTGLSRRTIDNVVSQARASSVIETAPLHLGVGWGVVLSIALGAETCRAALVDANGKAHCPAELSRLPDQRRARPEALLERIREVAERTLGLRSLEPKLTPDGRLGLLGVATAWPAPVRGSKRPAGSVLDSGWLDPRHPNLADSVADELDLPRDRSHAINDANAHGLAVAFDDTRQQTVEWFRSPNHARGPAPRQNSWKIGVVIRLGGAIGASTLLLAPERIERLSFLDSTLLGGARSLAGELAHFPIDRSNIVELNERGKWVDGLAPIALDRRCSCGREGHLEAYASGGAFMARMEASGLRTDDVIATIRPTDGRDLDEVEDPRIGVGLEDLGRLIGRSLTAPVLLLDPHRLTLTGSLGLPPVLRGIEAERDTWRHVFGDALRIEVIEDARRAFLGVRGAGLAVQRALVHRHFGDLLRRSPPLSGLTHTL